MLAEEADMFSGVDRLMSLDVAGLKVLDGVAKYMRPEALGRLVIFVRVCISYCLPREEFRGVSG